ncbi:MAG: PIG-L family deacetylase [Acidobacteriaceae bacterium]
MNRRRDTKIAGRFLALFFAALAMPACSQTAGTVDAGANAHRISIERGTPALWQTLRQLHTRASLIMFTAHPDDEDGGVLAYESRYVGADTTLLTLNRGEGGQNVMSANFWDQLGLVRTQEMLAADRYYGVHQYWTRVADFGFTKTKEEALQKWGYDRVLYDCVRVVRMTRPLVVASVFAGNVSDGHGQHQVSGEMAQEVFKAAADPKVFPDQIRAGLRPWAPLKVYVRVPFATVSSKGVYDYATGHWAPARFRNYVDNTWIEGKPSPTLTIPEGQYSPSFGLSYLQISRRGLNMQKSQNGGIGMPAAGPVTSGYRLYASRVSTKPEEATFFDGVDVSLAGIADYAPADQAGWLRGKLAAIDALVGQATREFSVGRPEKIAPLLAKGLVQTEALMQQVGSKPLPEDARYNILHELAIKRTQFNTALLQSLGLAMQAEVSRAAKPRKRGFFSGSSETFQAAIPGQKFNVQVHLANQGSGPVAVTNVRLTTNPDKDWKLTRTTDAAGELAAGADTDASFAVAVSDTATITKPYFTRPDLEQPYYDISDPAYTNLSLMPYPLSAQVTFAYRGAEIHLEQVVQTMHRVTGPGPVLDPMIVTPAISVWVSPKAGVVPLTSKSFRISALVHSNVKGPAVGNVSLQLPKGWTSTPAQASFTANHDGEEQNIEFQVQPKSIRPTTYTLAAIANYGGRTYNSGSTEVGYQGLRPYPYYRDAKYRMTGVDVRLPSNMRIGYINGTGDDVAGSLTDLGVQTQFLSPQDIATGDLSQFSAIILGVRAYAARPELKTYNVRLLDYVHGGGTLIVQYNTPEFDHNYGPYPYQLGNNPEKVVDENSKVVLPTPDYPALTWPNRLTSHDFDGWVEERGHGFMRTWDARYIALTETHDPGQDPQKGGLLIASYGKGFYVYEGYALYRELPEGVPGAFRIFANLLSLSSNPGLKKSAPNDK